MAPPISQPTGKKHLKPSTTSTSTIYNLTNHFSKTRLHPNPNPIRSTHQNQNRLSKKHMKDTHLQGEKEVLDSGKNKSLVVVKEIESKKEVPLIVNGMNKRMSFCDAQVELANFLLTNCAKVVSADMPPFMQIHIVGFARKIKDSLETFTSKNLALSLKKELDGVYGPAWHCIAGTSFGSFVTHSTGGFLYFSLDQKLYVLLFKTAVQRADAN